MSDGLEERQERKMRIEEEKKASQEDLVEREDLDDWTPERVDS